MRQLSDQAEMGDEIRRILEADRDILFAYLFGSRATEQAHFLSDIDIACFLRTRAFCDQRLATKDG